MNKSGISLLYFLFIQALAAVLAFTFFSFSAVYAAVPDTVQAMLSTASDADDKNRFDIILETALETWPGERFAILEMAQIMRPEWLAQHHQTSLEETRRALVQEEQRQRNRGVWYYLDPRLWDGEVNAGASSSSGDTSEKSLTLGFSLAREFDGRFEHLFAGQLDYKHQNNITVQEKFVTDYSLRWHPNDGFFLVNYTRLELDRFSGYDYRIIENIGIGYELIKTDRQRLSVEGGPGVRFSRFKDVGGSRSEFLGRASAFYRLEVTDNLTLEDKATYLMGSLTDTFENGLALSARINASLAARFGFDVRFESNPPAGTAAWDTITRLSIVYDF